jgi:hypothetical protein
VQSLVLRACSAAASDGCVVRIIELADPTNAFDVPLSRSPKALQFDPLEGRFLAASSIDGNLALVDVAARAPAFRIDSVKLPDNDDPDSSSVEFPLAWHPSGAVLAFGSSSGVHVIARESWATVYTLRSPSAAPERQNDKYGGTVALAWSPNGRFLAAIDSRRVITVWDAATAALDPVTRAPLVSAHAVVSQSPGQGDAGLSAGEPSVALHAFMGSFSPDAEDPSPESLSKAAVLSASPRPTAMHWHSNGTGLALVVADSNGCVCTARLGATPLAKSDASPVDELRTPLEWPLRVKAVAAATAAVAPGGEVAAPTSEGGKSSKHGSGRRLHRAAGYADGEAAESSGDESSGAGGAKGAAAAALRRPAAADDTDFSLSKTKRAFGYVDGDEDDGEGGGLRRVDDVGDDDGAAVGQSLEDLREAGVVTKDMLERHMIHTGTHLLCDSFPGP